MNYISKFLKHFKIPFLLMTCSLQAHSIVFIHIGQELPKHLSISVEQARLFNENCPIFIIANQTAIDSASSKILSNNVSFIPCESLPPSEIHYRYQNNPSHNMDVGGLWRYSSERFFYLEEFIRKYNLSDVFHLECDVMLYADLGNFLPIFKKNYNGMIGATFENDSRCVPAFLYISDIMPIQRLIEFFPNTSCMGQTDMEALASFKDSHHKTLIDYLPIVVPEYSIHHPLKAESNGQLSQEPKFYSNYIDEFGIIFDAAAWGIYLAGWDSLIHHKDISPGVITKYSVFDPSFFNMEWHIDAKGRKIPIVKYEDKKIPIANLHITNKPMIEHFYSIEH